MSISSRKIHGAVLTAMLMLACGLNARAQSGGLGLNPGRVEVEVNPGQEKTVGFHIDSPVSEKPVRGHLLLSLTDWQVNQDTSFTYVEPGSLPDSAAKWVMFSPSTVSIESGQSPLVRVTVKVPEGTAPGVYRAGIFVQERPPATPPKPGERIVVFRFRYVFNLYVIVGHLAGEGHVVDLSSVPLRNGLRIVCAMKNTGTRHVRPYIDGNVRDLQGNVVASFKHVEATVLLPAHTNEEPIVVDGLLPGRYQIEAQVDFQDGHPIQAVKRTFEVPIT